MAALADGLVTGGGGGEGMHKPIPTTGGMHGLL